jgi:hypothetical protein
MAQNLRIPGFEFPVAASPKWISARQIPLATSRTKTSSDITVRGVTGCNFHCPRLIGPYATSAKDSLDILRGEIQVYFEWNKQMGDNIPGNTKKIPMFTFR